MIISYTVSLNDYGKVKVYGYCFASCTANANCGNGSEEK